ncbi:hypothetical protein Btru_009980 [Bulinus truncatus]|nr:hypothetical protein Btru_009980 [Bulinus truncatus]
MSLVGVHGYTTPASANTTGTTAYRSNTTGTIAYRTSTSSGNAVSSLTHIQDLVRAISIRCPYCYSQPVLSSSSALNACMELENYKSCLNANCFSETYSDNTQDAAAICERFYSSSYGQVSGATWNNVHWITSLVLLISTIVFSSQ